MTRLERALGEVALAVLAASGSAHAQAPDDQVEPEVQPAPTPAPPPATTVEPTAPPAPSPPGPVLVAEPHPEENWLTSTGFALSIGGGVEDFSNATMRDTTGMGGSWNVRATLGTHRYLAVEGSYIGSAQSLDRLGLSRSTTLWGNGVQGALRLNMTSDYIVQPFVFAGAAYRYYSLSNSSINTSDVASHANVFELPAGVGLASYMDGFMIDVRGEYRWAWGENLVPGFSGTGNGLNRWGITANVGAEF